MWPTKCAPGICLKKPPGKASSATSSPAPSASEPTVQPDFDTFTLDDFDTVLLCTDGLTNALTEPAIQEILSLGDSAPALGGRLINEAKAAGARDNVTAIVVRVTSDVLPTKARREYAGEPETLASLAGPALNGGGNGASCIPLSTRRKKKPRARRSGPKRPLRLRQ